MPLPLANLPAQSCDLLHQHSTSRQLDAPAPLRFWHLASLDAPTVAVAWSLAFAWAIGVRLPTWAPVLLALGTWAVYVGDRLLDARAAIGAGNLNRLCERHFFHWRHRRILAPLALLAAGTAAAIIFVLMPVVIRERDSVLGVAALAYFSGVHSQRRPTTLRSTFVSKELLVGLLFTAGCALPALSRFSAARGPSSHLWPFLALIIFFAALAWLNCHAIERWESPVTASRILTAACQLGLAGLSLALAFAAVHSRLAVLFAAGAVSTLLLGFLDRMRSRLTPLALRAAADLVLLTPFILLTR